MDKAAIAATFVDFKNVKTRGVLQLVFEVPLHAAKGALDTLGYPDAGSDRWFAIAALKTDQKVSPAASDQRPQPVVDKPQAGVKREWRDLQPAQQAGIRCEEPTFGAFLMDERADDLREAGGDWAECVRLVCGVASRSELNTNQKARVIWHQLNDQYDAWLRVGA